MTSLIAIAAFMFGYAVRLLHEHLAKKAGSL